MSALHPTSVELPRPADGWRAELRQLLALAAPLVVANLLQMAVYAVDVVFVARLGTVELAAATLGVYAYSVVLFALIGLVGAAAPVIAAELGRRRHPVREARRSFRMAMWVGGGASLPFLALLWQGEALLRLAGQDPLVAARAGAFLRILLWSLPPAVLAAAMRTTAAALDRPGWVTAVTALSLGASIAANWAFVFGHLGFPAMGLEGSALASLVTTVVAMFAYVAILLLDPRLRRYRLFGRWWVPEWSRLHEIVRLGVPIALTYTFEAAVFSAAGLLMGLVGVAEVAAHAIALQIAAVAFQIPFGIAQAATIRVGIAAGAGSGAAVGRAGWVALALGTGVMVLTAAVLWSAPGALVALYIDPDAPGNARVAALAVAYLGVAALFQIVDGAQAVAAGVLRGLKDTRVPMLVAAGGYWGVGFVLSVALGFGLGLEGLGIWLGLAAGLAVVAVVLVRRWMRRDALGLLARARLVAAGPRAVVPTP